MSKHLTKTLAVHIRLSEWAIIEKVKGEQSASAFLRGRLSDILDPVEAPGRRWPTAPADRHWKTKNVA
jgi:hypothetical protein